MIFQPANQAKLTCETRSRVTCAQPFSSLTGRCSKTYSQKTQLKVHLFPALSRLPDFEFPVPSLHILHVSHFWRPFVPAYLQARPRGVNPHGNHRTSQLSMHNSLCNQRPFVTHFTLTVAFVSGSHGSCGCQVTN